MSHCARHSEKNNSYPVNIQKRTLTRPFLYMSRSVSRVLSRTTIYLGPLLPTGSSHLPGTAGPAVMSLHGVAPDRVYSVLVSPRDGCALTAPFHPYRALRGGISLLHLSEGCPWRVLPVILALWSPDFPHSRAFALCPRSFGLLIRVIFYSIPELKSTNFLVID